MSSEAPEFNKPLLPGFGRPIDFVPDEDDDDYVGPLFPSALSLTDMYGKRITMEAITLRELDMLKFMNAITDKPHWYDKIKDDEIVKKWKSEAMSSADISQKMADYCIDELRYNASQHTTDGGTPIIVFPGGVVKSDTAVSRELQTALQETVKRFEASIPEKSRDWHPGSDGLVLDLVHPSLCPLVYGQTRVLPENQTTTLEDCIDRCGEGEIIPVPDDEDVETFFTNNNTYSANFQWLPCEVNISGDTTKITSYINNLHPKETALYKLIENIIDASIPLWNLTLAPLEQSESRPRQNRRINYQFVAYDPNPASWPESEGPQREGDEVDGNDDAYWYRRHEWIRNTRKLVYPEPENFKAADAPEHNVLDLKQEYANRGLQIIIKLANIELTPEKPTYEGGSWHVEGQLNEHIVATSLYYYSCENITPSMLSFRAQMDEEELIVEVGYEQHDSSWLKPIFGCEQEGPAIQEIGGVDTKEGRLLTFPNILQHRVGPFSLADPTKPGHRKIVALFLVDPHIKVISTAHVPCQQQEWWWEKVMAVNPSQRSVPLRNLGAPMVSEIPMELQDNILEGVDFPFSMKKAKEIRLELMEERRAFVLESSKEFLEHATISLCEH